MFVANPEFKEIIQLTETIGAQLYPDSVNAIGKIIPEQLQVLIEKAAYLPVSSSIKKLVTDSVINPYKENLTAMQKCVDNSDYSCAIAMIDRFKQDVEQTRLFFESLDKYWEPQKDAAE